LPAAAGVPDIASPCFIDVFSLARRLLNDLQDIRPHRAVFVGVLAMMFALGAASSIWDALQSLTSSKSSSAQSGTSSQSAPSPFDLPGSSTPAAGSTPASGTTGWSQISPQTMSALISAQSQATSTSATSTSATSTSTAPTSPSSALQDLFSQIDGNGDGQISKSEFETALGAGGTNVAQADDVFSKLDKNGDGSVSLDEMKSALQGAGGHHGGHHHAHAAASTGDSSNTDPTTGASTTSADPLMQALDDSLNASAKANAANATPSYNAVEQMIQRGMQSTQPASASSISVTA
jgi:Ca2+-binding EF-hand superfamily protein